MGTMRNNFAEAFVLLLVLMLPTSQSFPHGKESSSRRNSLTNTLTSKVRSAYSSISGTTYECLFVDEKLPTCDVKWMLNSKEDTANSTSGRERRDLDARLDKVTESRPRSNFDPSKVTRVIVYTFEGCLPPIRRDRLNFLMPPCDGISLDQIVGVERFYPFAMKGAKKPPPVFPEVTRDQWLRMMVRLRNHVSSKARNKQHGVPVSKEATTNESSYELVKATQPNLGPPAAEKTETTMEIDHEQSSPSSSDVVVDDQGNKVESPPKKKSLDHFRRKIPNKYVHQRETIVLDGGKSSLGDKEEDLVEIPPAPFAIEASKAFVSANRSVYKKMAVDDTSSDFASTGDSERFSKLSFDAQRATKEGENGIAKGSKDLLDSSEAIAEAKRKREIRLHGNVPFHRQAILDEAKARGIAGKHTHGFEKLGGKSRVNLPDRSFVPDKLSMFFRKLWKNNEKGTVDTKIPSRVMKSLKEKSNSNFSPLNGFVRDKIDPPIDSKSGKGLPRETRKKYRNYLDLLLLGRR